MTTEEVKQRVKVLLVQLQDSTGAVSGSLEDLAKKIGGGVTWTVVRDCMFRLRTDHFFRSGPAFGAARNFSARIE